MKNNPGLGYNLCRPKHDNNLHLGCESWPMSPVKGVFSPPLHAILVLRAIHVRGYGTVSNGSDPPPPPEGRGGGFSCLFIHNGNCIKQRLVKIRCTKEYELRSNIYNRKIFL